MLKEINNKIVFYGSCLLAAYFGFLLLDAFVFHLDFVLIGFFQELLTIPALLLLLFMLVFTAIRWVKAKFKLNGYTFLSFSLSVLTTATLVLVTVLEEPSTTKKNVVSTARYNDEGQILK